MSRLVSEACSTVVNHGWWYQVIGDQPQNPSISLGLARKCDFVLCDHFSLYVIFLGPLSFLSLSYHRAGVRFFETLPPRPHKEMDPAA